MTMWANQNQHRTKTEEIVEMCLIGYLFYLSVRFHMLKYEPEVFRPSVNEFEQYPLQAWQTTDIIMVM